MSIVAPGARLGFYDIIAALGAGGMGEVWRARDTKLGREVALKILPAAFTSDPDRVARFTREAQVLAALNHPHIAQIYGLEEAGDVRALVIELVDGGTLADRIARGPISVDLALGIAKQIAEALEAAHEKGIIHRDLKPSNIAFTKDGQGKVLDFGLAKLAAPEVAGPGVASPLSMSPTITSPALVTGAGMLLGTAAYMSPEQAKGKEADKRSDIWAFGVILLEMLTGRSPFAAETVSETLAYVITRDADVDAAGAAARPLREVIRRCLVKDPYRRIRDIGDVRIALDESRTVGSAPAPDAPPTRGRGLAYAPWFITAVTVILAGVIVAFRAPGSTPRAGLMQFTAELGGDLVIRTDMGSNIALSPNGSMLAFAASRRGDSHYALYVRRLSDLTATLLPDTEDAHDPFFSSDGQRLGFFTRQNLKAIDLPSGAPRQVIPGAWLSGTWLDDGSIVFGAPGPGQSLKRLMPGAASAQQISVLDTTAGEINHRFPRPLGTDAITFTTAIGGYTNNSVVAQSLGKGTRKTLITGAGAAIYAPSGHLLYVQTGERGSLFAAPFDSARLELTGAPVRVADGVASGFSGTALFTLSRSGVFAYVQGPGWTEQEYLLSWLDSAGHHEPLIPAGNYAGAAFSPDGRKMAIESMDNAGDIWIFDLDRGISTRLTFSPTEDRNPAWTPDGLRIAYISRRGDGATPNVWWQRADGSGEAQRLTTSKNSQYAGSWHPNGSVMAFSENRGNGNYDVMMLPMTGSEREGWKPGTPYAFVSTPYSEQEPSFSPDGRWLAYQSDESGRAEIYVRPFPGPGPKWQVSSEGGSFATWSRTGGLFYIGGDHRLWTARYRVNGDSFVADKPRVWADVQVTQRPAPTVRPYDIQPGSGRVAVLDLPASSVRIHADRVVFVLNLLDYLRRMAPPAK